MDTTNPHTETEKMNIPTNSTNSPYLAGMTDTQIREGIDKHRERLIRVAMPGKDVSGTNSVGEALAKAGADFLVEKKPVMAVVDAETAVEVPGCFVTLRSDTHAPLSSRSVGSTYEVVQTADAFAAADILIANGDLSPTTVKVNGAKIRLSGIIGGSAIERLDSDRPDLIAHFGSFSTAHDGTGGIEASLFSLRVVCFNGMTSRQHVQSVKIRHTRSATDRIAQAASAILGLRESAVQETILFQRLARQRMTREDFTDFASDLLNAVRQEADTDRKRAKRDADLQQLESLFVSGQGNSGSSLWDGYNSVTEWLDHKLTRGGVSNAQRRLTAFESNDSGHGNKIKSRALRMLVG